MTEDIDVNYLIVKRIQSLVEAVNQDKEQTEAQKITAVAHLIVDLQPQCSIPLFLSFVEETVYKLKQLVREEEEWLE